MRADCEQRMCVVVDECEGGRGGGMRVGGRPRTVQSDLYINCRATVTILQNRQSPLATHPRQPIAQRAQATPGLVTSPVDVLIFSQ